MDHLSEQYPTDQRKEKRHEAYFCKKKQEVLIQVIILKVKGKQSCSLILIWCSSELLLLNCLKYPEILKMLLQIYKTVLELCYKSCDESRSRASSYIWNALATTIVKKCN
jgi:hypothetical protein